MIIFLEKTVLKQNIMSSRAATKFMVHQSKVSGNWEVNKSELHVLRISGSDGALKKRDAGDGLKQLSFA